MTPTVDREIPERPTRLVDEAEYQALRNVAHLAQARQSAEEYERVATERIREHIGEMNAQIRSTLALLPR